ncbi:MAG: hypothetical protein KDC00_14960, partial [Flavobacteriales bacterium]|nr:hypothetical protein [Flavobacteriales bacterium]
MKEVLLSRRAAVKSTLLGMVAVSLPNLVRAGGGAAPRLLEEAEIFHRYPSIDDAIVSTVVGKSHFDLEAVQQLVEPRPELARATWDWSFGDWESALGAASHVGRRDIANYLIGKGARPTIFTYAMFGKHAAVKAMVQGMPGVQRTAGPHGIDLLTHARIGAGSKGLSAQEQEDCERTV